MALAGELQDPRDLLGLLGLVLGLLARGPIAARGLLAPARGLQPLALPAAASTPSATATTPSRSGRGLGLITVATALSTVATALEALDQFLAAKQPVAVDAGVGRALVQLGEMEFG